MFANTLTLTVNSVAKVLTRLNQDNFGSTYSLKSATDQWTLRFRNATENTRKIEKYDRHNMFVEYVVFATPTTTEKRYTISSTLRMKFDSDPAYLAFIATAFNVLMNAQSSGLIAGES